MNDVDFPVLEVLKGIEAAQTAGLGPLKVNMVVKRGTNEQEILPMVGHFKGSGVALRFIEYMDVGATNGWRMNDVLPSHEVLELIRQQMPLVPLPSRQSGETAQRWGFANADGSHDAAAGEVGFISSVTQAFCGDCNRARLSTEGQLYLCLFAGKGHDLRTLLRTGGAPPELRQAIANVWSGRSDRYSALRGQAPNNSPTSERRVEMSYIGGNSGARLQGALHPQVGQGICTLVARVACVALDPLPVNPVTGTVDQGIHALPQVYVFHWLLAGSFPTLGFPAGQPLGHALEHVLAVHMQGHLAGAFEGSQGLDHRHHFHAVVGGTQLSPEQFFFRPVSRTQQSAPAAGPRITFACTIGVNHHFAQYITHTRSFSPFLTAENCDCCTTGTAAGLRLPVARHWLPSKRIPRTRLVATTKYVAPKIGHQRAPIASNQDHRPNHLTESTAGR